MAAEENDRRLHKGHDRLKGRAWSWQQYRRPRVDWDHDHCELCLAKFMEQGEGTLQAGFSSRDGADWVCATCYDDFRELFGWTASA